MSAAMNKKPERRGTFVLESLEAALAEVHEQHWVERARKGECQASQCTAPLCAKLRLAIQEAKGLAR